MVSKLRKIAGTVVVIITMAFIFVMVLNFTMKMVVHQKKEVMVPDLTGKTVVQAVNFMGDYELYLKKVAEQFNEDYPDGTIIDQQPRQGMIVKEGKVIRVIVSSGGKVIFIPELIGKPLREATLILRQVGLLLGEITKTYSTRIKKDYVISQDPVPEEIANKGTMVNLVVSQGLSDEITVIVMPNLVGKNIRDIRKILKGTNIKIGKMRMISDNTVLEGNILRQNPEADEIISEDTEVNLLIAKKSEDYKAVKNINIYYEVSQGLMDKGIRILVEDEQGERLIYDEKHSPGTKISMPVQILGEAKVKIFVNDILVEERKYD